jgi:sporulation protein YlmC with PRC-barrel domain
MKKKEVYEKKYRGKQVNEYYNLICKIREESFNDSIIIDNRNIEDGWSERGYISFDGDFLVRVSKNRLNQYNKNMSIARITVEKIGPDPEKESNIEKMLKEEGFKKILD